MANFIKYDYKQDVMLVINFEEQLHPGTFEYAIHYLIDNKLDLSVFHPKFKNNRNSWGQVFRRAFKCATLP